MTALMLCKQPAIAKLLLDAGADVHSTTDTSSNTCLHIAAAEGYTAAVTCMLLKAGADMSAVNREGNSSTLLNHAHAALNSSSRCVGACSTSSNSSSNNRR
eukprot:4102-Heterococcus_DN1.PRE.1